MKTRCIWSCFLRCTTAIVFAVMAAGAHAGGLWINEFGSPAMGRAGAGSLSSIEDASAALHNPASMTAVEGEQFMAALGLISTDVQFDLESSEAIQPELRAIDIEPEEKAS